MTGLAAANSSGQDHLSSALSQTSTSMISLEDADFEENKSVSSSSHFGLKKATKDVTLVALTSSPKSTMAPNSVLQVETSEFSTAVKREADITSKLSVEQGLAILCKPDLSLKKKKKKP